MNKAFEKILERLDKEEKLAYKDMMIAKRVNVANYHSGEKDTYRISRKIVQEVAEEYNNGWIPCSERLPSGLDFVLYTHKDGEVDICSIEYFYDYLDKFTAWQPLPEPYQESD